MTGYRIDPGRRKLPPPAEQPKPRKPMRRVSKERSKLMREVAAWRGCFIIDMRQCQICGKKLVWRESDPITSVRSLSVHEIAKGPCRSEAMKHRECCLVACDICNCGPLCDYKIWPIERQLAVKLLTDPEYFDLELFNKVRGRAPTAITLADVVPYLQLKPTR